MDLTPLITRYAERFAALGDAQTQSVSSPLGAWLLLALAGPLAEGDVRAELEDALGTDVDSAHDLLIELLAHPHPAVATALAAWRNDLPGLRDWASALPPVVQQGLVPSQSEADAWSRDHTFGLIDRFPIDLTADVVILLASALATKVGWFTDFDVVPADHLPGPWGDRLERVLHTPQGEHTGHDAFVARTDRAGTVAVHRGASSSGLDVTSVIAERGVARADVLAAAHDLAARQRPRRVSLFDLPLGDSPLWRITEETAARRGEHVDAVLPAWRAKSEFNLLTSPGLGLGAAGQALVQGAGLGGAIEAKQSAVAEFSRTGFEAAAVTGLAVAVSMMMPPPEGPYRTAVLHFGHPYAVVAAASAVEEPWRNLPVFAAWVTDPHDADPG